MKKYQLITVIGASVLLGACATPHKDVASLDAQIADISQGDFGQFLYHQSMAEQNLTHLQKIRTYWNKDWYWNIENEQCAQDSAAKAKEHAKQAEEALSHWWDAEHGRHMAQMWPTEGQPLLPVAYFDTGSAVPKSLQQEHIAKLLDLAKAHSDLELDLVAYTDTVGGHRSNHELASRRAHAVNNVLVKEGLPASVRVHEIAEGEAPGPDNTPSADNRRVDVRLHHGYYESHPYGHPHHPLYHRHHRKPKK